MRYYDYYSYSYLFYFFIFFLFILIIFSFPVYTKKSIVTGLSDTSYPISVDNNTKTLNDNINKSVFQDLRITEDGDEPNIIDISYNPVYTEANNRFMGFYCLTLVTKDSHSFAFRIVDKNKIKNSDENTLEKYNYGWSSLTTRSSTKDNHYSVNIPFLLPSNRKGAKLTVQISHSGNINNSVSLYSSELYYISY